jgi:hypothetical protein
VINMAQVDSEPARGPVRSDFAPFMAERSSGGLMMEVRLSE